MVERRERFPRPAKPTRVVALRRGGVAPQKEKDPLPPTSGLRPEEKRLMIVLGVGITVAVLFPFPVIKFTLVGVLGIFMLWVFMTDLRLALCVLPIIIPAQTLIGGTFNLLPGLNYETLLILLILVAWSSQRGAYQPALPAKDNPAFYVVIVAFLVAIVLSAAQTIAIGNPPLMDLVQTFKNQWIYTLLLPVIADCMRTERDRIRFMVAICLAMILVAIQPIYHAADDLAHGASLLRHRAVSLIAIQPNIYGGALACFACFPLMYFTRKIGGHAGRIMFGISAGVAVYVLVLTLSRGSWLAMGAASLLIGMLFERKLLIILVLGALSFPFWVPEEAFDRANEMKVIDVNDPNLKQDEGSAFVRVEQWRLIPTVLAENPFFGHGYERFPWVYRRLGSYHFFKGAHVGYCEYATEAGVIGLGLYVAIFLSLAAFAFRLATQGTTVFARTHGVALLGATVAMAVAEGFGSRLKVGSVTAFLWMYAGVGVACWKWPPKEEGEVSAGEHKGLIRRVARRPALVPKPPVAGALGPE